MFHSDARNNAQPETNVPFPISHITTEVVAKIEIGLEPYDMNSLVFLLYDVPDTALQKLSTYQRVAKEDSNMNLLSSWARHQQSGARWREQFLEALAICQLFNIVRRLGLQVTQVKDYYQPDSLDHHVYVNPMKKALYKLCENITSEELQKIKKAILTYDHECDMSKYESCELVFLKLMSLKIITVPNVTERDNFRCSFDVDLLVDIIKKIAALQKLASKIKDIQSMLNKDPKSSTPTSSSHFFEGNLENDEESNDHVTKAFDNVYKILSELTLEEKPLVKNLKSDKQRSTSSGAYKIKDPKRVGVVYIINQVKFYPSKESIAKNQAPNELKERHGSNKDRCYLKKTFEALHFEVIAHTNIDHDKMKELITNIVEYRIQPNDSMFVLCILSHGVHGHVYAADSVQVKVEDIKNWLENSFQQRKLDIPKLMILQACQVNNEPETGSSRLMADSLPNRYLKKAHFLVYWATAPELEAFRDEKKGSIFIQILCYALTKHAKHEDIFSIFTKVTKIVAQVCTQLDKDQTPIFESTLTEKLYLQEIE